MKVTIKSAPKKPVREKRAKNPVPSSRSRAEQAESLYERFREQGATSRRSFDKHQDGLPDVGIVIGLCNAIEFERDGQEWRYEFPRARKPRLCSTHDGKRIFLHGDTYQFPDQGRIGRVLAVEYDTVRKGKKEYYRHDFAKSSRPMLHSDLTGLLFITGGRYSFTDCGITDH